MKLKRFFSLFYYLLERVKRFHKRIILNHFEKQDKIFILGVQKSGTTAIAALLADCTDQPATLDIVRSIRRPGSRILRNYGVEGFDDYIYRYRSEFSKKIVKEPSLTFDYYNLVEYFPRARFVIIMREPKDNIRSILNRLKLPGDLKEINPEEWPELRESPAWRMNLDSTWLGYPPRNYVDSLAYRWLIAAEIYNTSPENFVMLRYEDFLNNKKAVIEGLADSLGLQVIKDISLKVDTQYQPKGKSVSNYSEYYRENLQYIQDHCSELASKLGYDS